MESSARERFTRRMGSGLTSAMAATIQSSEISLVDSQGSHRVAKGTLA